MGDHAVVPVEEYPVEVRMAVKRLKPRQRLFCEYLAGHADYVQAYMDAGYKTKDRDVASAAASRLLKNVRVTTYLNYLRMKKAARLAESQKLTTDYIINNLIETVERCRQVRPVIDGRTGEQRLTEDADGNLVPAYEYQPMAVLKGLELLGRHLGMFNDKLTLIPGAAPATPDELQAEIDEYEAEEG